MTQEVKRRYALKDIDMLLSAATIMDSAIENEKFLSAKRSTWASPYFQNVRVKIDQVITDYIGLDGVKELRQATQSLKEIQAVALIDLSELKVQIGVDFEKDRVRRDEILTMLGFTQNHKDARTGDQEALISLLYQLNTNLSAELKTELSNKGIAMELLDRLNTYASNMKEADIFQEGKKGTRKVITAQALNEFNEVYLQVSGIAKIAKNFYRDDKARGDKFLFSKVAGNLNRYPKRPLGS